jgi:uncharacterized protein (UPF0147 family)
LSQKNTEEKIKTILQVMSQLTTDNEIISRIEMFQKNIMNFMINNDSIIEIISYIKYLYIKNNVNGKIKSLSPLNKSKNSIYSFHRIKKFQKKIKDFYDFNKFRRTINNNHVNKKYNNKSYKYLSANKFISILNNKNKNDNLLCSMVYGLLLF